MVEAKTDVEMQHLQAESDAMNEYLNIAKIEVQRVLLLNSSMVHDVG